MPKKYQVTPMTRLVNWLISVPIRLGLTPRNNVLLTVPGRKSGKRYTTPVTLVEDGRERWLVAPYGAVNWVRNARAAGHVTLTHGRRSQTVKLTELGSEESAPVLKKYLQQVSIVRPYFNAQPDSPLEDFEAEAGKHPVFRIEAPRPE